MISELLFSICIFPKKTLSASATNSCKGGRAPRGMRAMPAPAPRGGNVGTAGEALTWHSWPPRLLWAAETLGGIFGIEQKPLYLEKRGTGTAVRRAGLRPRVRFTGTVYRDRRRCLIKKKTTLKFRINGQGKTTGQVLSRNEGEGEGGCTLCPPPQLQLQARWLRAPRLCRDRGHGSLRKIRLRGQSR